MKEGNFVLFCFVVMRDPLNWDASDCVLGVFGKLLTRKGPWGLWFHDVWSLDSEYKSS